MDTDIIIAGGGLAGATLAALLCRQNVHCTVLEARQPDDKGNNGEIVFDPRTLAITAASANILRHAEAWPIIPSEKIGYFRRMQVWDEQGKGEISFDSADICAGTLGYIIEQSILESALYKACSLLPSCNFLVNTRLEDFRTSEESMQVELTDGRKLSGRLLIGADGANSKVRQIAGIPYPKHDYQQQAVAGVIETELPHEDIARQCFLANGPLAFLPMAAANCCGFVWSTSPGHARELLEMDEPAFNDALTMAFSGRLGNVTKNYVRSGFPLLHAHAAGYCQSRLALIGDAAHIIHPLAGQGANMGLLDAAVLAEELLKEIEHGRDPGVRHVLRRYERWRKGENYLMLKVLQGMKNLFASHSSLVCYLRNTGLDITDKLHPLKHCIMRYAMGMSGELPVFARKPD